MLQHEFMGVQGLARGVGAWMKLQNKRRARSSHLQLWERVSQAQEHTRAALDVRQALYAKLPARQAR